ncbi:GlxA family transcriptional regulator [Paraburkholderia susongensis]|uniref:Transcriptional regulator, AraC family with amidase-like domain n=1 Tax=Paraburkholderia susongensis TaxID=1515439 RepID=A0A1X7M1Y3_9BURK|nr:helix-turn-helix domain-containing protein [Paraburkholderia susongensis]SMG59502.1 transcriptional regulator, AraC family with amidase-like domain [Paraburkholderia susongensis]
MPRDKSDKVAGKTAIRPLPQKTSIGILLYGGARLAAAHGLTDLFEAGNYYSAQFGGGHPATLEVSHWRISPDSAQPGCVFSSHGDPPSRLDCLIIAPPVNIDHQTEETENLLDWVTQQHASGTLLCAVCGGVFMLARTGMLNGRSATTHWNYARILAEWFPELSVNSDELIIDLGDVITAGGVLAWVDLGLRLVDRYLGPVVMVKTAQFFLADPAGRQQRFYANFAPSLHHGDKAVLDVQLWLQTTHAQAVTVEQMATKAQLGHRTFLRRFQKATGLKPTEYAQRLKIQKARELLEFTTLSIKEISWKVGYEDTGFFRKTFEKFVGLGPTDYRRRFGTGGRAALGTA